jgi:hypothetical protein
LSEIVVDEPRRIIPITIVVPPARIIFLRPKRSPKKKGEECPYGTVDVVDGVDNALQLGIQVVELLGELVVGSDEA